MARITKVTALIGTLLAGSAGLAFAQTGGAPAATSDSRPAIAAQGSPEHGRHGHHDREWRGHRGHDHKGHAHKGHHGRHGGHGLFFGRHVDGTLAFAKAELKITPQQEAQWAAVEAAVRAGAERMKQVRETYGPDRAAMRAARAGGERPQPVSAVDRVTRMEARTVAMAETLRGIRIAFEPLYASMSDAQKQTADKLLSRARR